MLEVESGVDPGVTKERGCRTITSRAELSGFLKYQRRAPALYIPIFSPDGETTSAQLRPNNPRVRDGKPIKYETPGGSEIILDVHPRNMAAIKDASRRLWATEGIKKGDALTSRGECAISLSGVWNWGKDGELLRCWEHVALEGREVFAVFDSDVMLKENVQLALERLVAALEPRGATVKVIYLSNAGDNSKVGVDDYLAAGGTVEELVDLAQPYNPSEFTRIRLSRDERLRLLVKDLWSTWRAMPTVKQGELTRRSVMRCLIRAGENSGKPVEDGLRVTVSSRTIALQASIGQPAVSKAIAVLE